MRRPATSLAINDMDHIPSIGDLFDAMNLNHPPPSMPENRARRPGAFTRSRSSSSHRSLHGGFLGPSIPLQDVMWDRNFYGPGHSQTPFPSGRVEELGDYDMPRSMSADGINDYQDPTPRNNYLKPPPYAAHERRFSFEQAAASMYAALVTANQECRSIEKSFTDDVRNVMRWLPSSYLDSLWMIRIGWDGSHINNNKCGTAIKAVDNSTSVSYDSVVKRFTTALQGMKTSTPPQKAPESGSGSSLSWEVLRTTMRKFEISLEAVEELLQLTRSRRDRMPLLLHELASAIHILESVRDVWETGPTTRGGGERCGPTKGKAREMPPHNGRNHHVGPDARDFGCGWSDYGGGGRGDTTCI